MEDRKRVPAKNANLRGLVARLWLHVRWIILTYPLYVSPSAIQAGSDTGPTIVLEAAPLSLHALQVIDAEETPSEWRWATWQFGAGADHSVEIMLLRREGSHAKPIWSSIRPDGYAPKITRVWSWEHNGKPTLLFLYQTGAEAEELEFYGLSRDGRPHMLGKSSAAIFVPSVREMYFIEARSAR